MYKNIINEIEKSQIKLNIPYIKSGYFVKIEFNLEKSKKRIQSFSGIIISKRNKQLSSSIIVRKISHGEGVEKTFYIHSPNIINISIYKKIKTRRSKLYFIRNKNKLIK